MFAKLFKKNKSKSEWRQVSELGVGMRIAVTRAGLTADHLGGNSSKEEKGDDVFWDEIVSVQPAGREPVYDIEVAGTRNFVGNNIFAHNTYLSGNVGVGAAPSPDYKVSVAGEVAAQGFVNVSTEKAKKDIEYLDEEAEKSALHKIRETKPATYQYISDPGGEQRLGLIAENAPGEVLSASGKGVDLYKLGTFVLAGLKAESKEREAGVLALDTKIAAEMSALRENTATKQLTVSGSGNGDLLVVNNVPSPFQGEGRVRVGEEGTSDEPIFRIAADGTVVVRDDIVFSPKTTTIALDSPTQVVALSEEQAQEQLRPAYKGAVIVAMAADGVHIFNPKTHKEMSGYAYQESESQRVRESGLPRHIKADYFTEPIDDNTLAIWPFKTLADATGNGNDLSMTGNVSLAAQGVRGTAAAFDGSGYLNVPSPFQGEGRVRVGGDGVTLGAWVKFNTLSSGQKIISQDGAFSLSLADAGRVAATAQGVSKVATRESLTALDNNWHYIVASYSPLKGRLDIYIDGVLSNGDLVGEIPLTGLGVSSGPVKVGQGLYGVLDDVFVAGGDASAEVVRANYLIGRKAMNYGLAATSGLQAEPTASAVDSINNILYAATKDNQIITVDLGASAVVGRQTITNNQSPITKLAVSAGAGRTLAAIVGNQLWLDTETVSVRDALAKIQVPSPFQGEGRVRVGEGERRALTVFEDLLITGGKILPEASSGLPLFAITSDGIVEGLAFRDVSFVNELANASFEYWPEAPRSLGEGEVRVGKPLGWQGSAKSTDAKFGSTSVQISDGVLSTSLSNASDFASSTVTLSAWVKTGAADDAKLALVAGGNPETSMAESYYHSGNGQWERLIVSAVIPASAADIKIKITSASKTALVDGVMFQRGSLPTAFVPAVSDVMLANPQYLNFTADIVASASSTPGEVIIAKIPAGTFRNKMRVDQISVGLDKDAAITFSVKNGAEQILCTTTGSTCRASGSLSITPETELIISYQTNEPVDAKATVNLRYYPEP